ncbi:MFS transporter [Nonomuraea sediminis]|uniref:MFS transporter n=1 Tax=Nonomuraea sediminis TaxID=2835864 RepID=UPI001BDD8F5A|nr:MFS transporter [Nonomuraea sediminis]
MTTTRTKVRSPWPALALLCTANFMVVLDAQIVILALPSIERDLGLDPGPGQWVLSAYLLTFGGLLLLGGRLADLLGRRRMFMAGTTLFLVSSLVCGLAWAGWVLVAARVVQGMSAALMAPTALSILMTMFPEGAPRDRALAVWSGTGGLGATAALLIGGALTGGPGWEWIFYLNVPVAAVLLALGPVLLVESREAVRERRYDPVGAVTVTASLMLLIAAIVRAPADGWSAGMAGGAVLLMAVFVLAERRAAAPLVPLRIFRSRLFVGGNLAMLLVGMTAWGTSVTVSGYAQDVLRFSPLVFGYGTAVLTLGAVAGAAIAQAALRRTSLAVVASACMVLLGAGALLLTGASPGGGYFADIFPGLLLFGPGLGGGTVALASAALSGVRESEAGVASGINTAAFQLGGAIGTAVVTSAIVVGGFPAGFAAGVAFAAVGLLVTLTLRPAVGVSR